MNQRLITNWKKDEKAHFEGWDFSYLKGRMIEDKLPWNYIKLAREFSKKSENMLDMGTGGGEILLQIKPAAKKIIATEGYPPNVIVARKNLKKLKVKVFDFSKHNVKKMPFPDDSFDLIINRHDAYDLDEVYRILKPNGIFLTQQVGTGNLRNLKKFFGVESRFKGMSLKDQIPLFKKAGFKILKKKEFTGNYHFKDVGALVYYLHAIPWVVKDFSVDSHKNYLLKLNKRKKLEFALKRFLIVARKEGE